MGGKGWGKKGVLLEEAIGSFSASELWLPYSITDVDTGGSLCCFLDIFW